jgi:D-glucuronyl C5-epimerase C-terminus
VHPARWSRSVWLWLGVAVLGASLPGHAVAVSVGRPASLDSQAGGYRPGVDYRVSGYRPKPVPARELPGYLDYVTPLSAPNIPVDSHGVALALNKRRKVYHPLVIARYGITLLQSYRITQHKAYLDRVSTNASFLLDHAVSRDGALYFPYRFTYALFGNRRDLMRAPWYSAMAQGAALTLFVRLYAATGDQRWRAAADATFATFRQRRSTRRPWVVFVRRWHNHRDLWLEDYAKNPPMQVLSGHLDALFGVYEYAVATRKPAATTVFDGGATTVRRELARFRVPGGISYYSLRVRVQDASYHCIHIGQLELLARMTAVPWFARAARRFAADAPQRCSQQRGPALRRAFPRHPLSRPGRH